MIETIIVPLDGSELAESALPMARELQEKFAAKLVLIRAVEPALGAPGATTLLDPPAAVAAEIELSAKVQAQARDDAESYLKGVAERVAPAAAETVIVEDLPADAIVNIAKERSASLIVMSSRGRGGLGRLVFGSVAESVLRNSTTPVLIIKQPEN